MNVLVVGGSRFVGALTVWRLLARGDRVTLVNRGTDYGGRAFGGDAFGARVEHLVADRRGPDFARVLGGRRFDATVDFAVYDEADARSALATLGERAGHYVMISTGQVYLVRRGCPRPARETDYAGVVLPRPDAEPDLGEWAYGVGKRAAEDALVLAGAAGFQATRVRIPMVHGERDYFRRLESYVWRLLDGGPVLVPDGGTAPTRHVYGDDVARFIVSILGQGATFGRAYNLAQRETPSLHELLSWLRSALGTRSELVDIPAARLAAADLPLTEVSPLSSTWMSFIDPTRAFTDLDFRPTPVDEYLGRIVAAFLAHPPAVPPDTYRSHRPRELVIPTV